MSEITVDALIEILEDARAEHEGPIGVRVGDRPLITADLVVMRDSEGDTPVLFLKP